MQASPGAALAVPIIVDMSAAGANATLTSLATQVTWNAARLTLDSVAHGTFGTLAVNTTNAPSGDIAVSLSATTAVPAVFTMATAYFHASSTTGGSRLTLSPTVAHDQIGATILASVRPRQLDVCVAPATGLWGDVLGHNTVNIIDAQQIARFSVGLAVANQAGVTARGDVTGDGTVNIIDAQQIARYSVGLSATPRTGTASYAVPAVASIAISSSPPSYVAGATLQLAATPRDAGGNDVTGCIPLAWSSNAPSIASVNTSGFVATLAAGTVNVSASSGAISASVPMTIGSPPVSSYASWSWGVDHSSQSISYVRMWGNSASDVYAVGVDQYLGGFTNTGGVLHFDGTVWNETHVGTQLFGVGGSSGSDVLMVGPAGIFSWNGSNVVFVAGSPQQLNAVWSAPDGTAFAVGYQGTILHRRSGVWTADASGTTARLTDVWGTSGSDVWAVGDAGTVRHYNGAQWTNAAFNTVDLVSVFGRTSGDVYAAGNGLTLFHFDGAQWTSLPVCVAPPGSFCINVGWLGPLWAPASSAEVFAGRPAHYAGTAWNLDDEQAVFGSTFLAGGGVWGTSPSNVYEAGTCGHVLQFDGMGWQIARPPAYSFQAIARAPDSSLVAVGRGGTVMRYRNGAWLRLNTGSTADLRGVWAGSNGTIISVGSTSAPLVGVQTVLLVFDGSTWTQTTLPGATVGDLSGIWATSLNSVYFAVDQRPNLIVFHFDGSAVTAVHSIARGVGQNTLLGSSAVAGTSGSDIYVGAGFGVVAHFDGSSWTDRALPDVTHDIAITGPGAMTISQGHGVARFSGSEFTLEPVGATCVIERVDALQPTDVTALSNCGETFHFDGRVWRRDGGVEALVSSSNSTEDRLVTLDHVAFRVGYCGRMRTGVR